MAKVSQILTYALFKRASVMMDEMTSSPTPCLRRLSVIAWTWEFSSLA
jgi:hypothetical protein